MNNFIKRVRYVKLSDIFEVWKLLICFAPAMIFRFFEKDLWLICEDANEARDNGYWIGKTFWICPRCVENYHFIPLLFLLGIMLTSFLYCIGFPLLGNIMWSLYWGLTVIMTIMAIPKCKNNAHLLALPIIFFSLHLSYGLGTLKGIIKL